MKTVIALLLSLVVSATAMAQQNPKVEIKTSAGLIVAELYQDRSPKTVANFLQYAKDGFYDGTIFHRVIDNFMIQGGGFDKSMREKRTRGPIENEATNKIRNDVGTLAMARTPQPHSASAQFFINLKDNDFLNFREPTTQGFGYAVFGKVTQGMDVVQKIAKVKTGRSGPHADVPVEPILIESIAIVGAKPEAKK
jgi:cyclophilin family peptidyl-prolyl cis-trans isomerase